MKFLRRKSFAEQEGQLEGSQIISIWIDGYDDLFSDFDSRDFSQRTISDDFLQELTKQMGENGFLMEELNLMISTNKRIDNQETIIAKRLHKYFRKKYIVYLKKKKSEMKKGLSFLVVGIIMLAISGYVSLLESRNSTLHVLFVILEPGSGFLVWLGLDDIFYLSEPRSPKLNFYKKLSNAKISFMNSEK